MRHSRFRQKAAAALVALTAMASCREAKPILPKRPLPPGTFQAHFTKKIRGPLELTIDGARVPVEQRKKRGRTLTVSGLTLGTHQYFFYCQGEVIGPDMGELEMDTEAGVFQVHFSQRLKVAYQAPKEAPSAQGAGPIRAVLE